MNTHRYFSLRSERTIIAILLLLLSSGAVLLTLGASPSSAVAGEPSQADTIYRRDHYVGPPAHLRGAGQSKFASRRVLDLNVADSVTLTRVPGIGPAFAHRILELRRRLGGYYTVLQLQEVYGMDEDKFLALKPWFRVGRLPKSYRLDSLISGSVPHHPYLSYAQVKALNRLINRHGAALSWRILRRDACFSREDSIRLSPYFLDPR